MVITIDESVSKISLFSQYYNAVLDLRAAGRVVTRASIAQQLECSKGGVAQFFLKHPNYVNEWGVLSGAEATREELRGKLLRIALKLRDGHGRTTKGQIAQMVGMDETNFCKYLKADSSLENIIKPVLWRPRKTNTS